MLMEGGIDEKPINVDECRTLGHFLLVCPGDADRRRYH